MAHRNRWPIKIDGKMGGSFLIVPTSRKKEVARKEAIQKFWCILVLQVLASDRASFSMPRSK